MSVLRRWPAPVSGIRDRQLPASDASVIHHTTTMMDMMTIIMVMTMVMIMRIYDGCLGDSRGNTLCAPEKSFEPKNPLLHTMQLFSAIWGWMQRLNLVFVKEGHFYVM